MIFEIFFGLSLVQGSKFDFSQIYGILEKETKVNETRFPIFEPARFPVRPIGETFVKSTNEHYFNPTHLIPKEKVSVYDDFPARNFLKFRRVEGEGLEIRQAAIPNPNSLDRQHRECPSNPFIHHQTNEKLANIKGPKDAEKRRQRNFDELSTLPQLGSPALPKLPLINELQRRIDQISAPNSVLSTNSSARAAFLKFLAGELKEYNDRSYVQRRQINTILIYIANNDLAGFERNESDFNKAFKHDYKHLEKDNIRILPSYIICFGATKFMDIYNSFSDYKLDWHLRIKAHYFLIRNQPLSVVLEFIQKSKYIPEKYEPKIFDSIRMKYPEMIPSHRLTFENVLRERAEARVLEIDEKRRIINEILEKYFQLSVVELSHIQFKSFLRIPATFPNYFSHINDDFRFLIARIAVIHEDVYSLVKFIENDPRVATMNYKEENLVDLAVKEKKMKIFPLLLSVVPELAMEPRSDVSCSLYESLIMADNVEMIQAFEDAGLSSEEQYINGQSAIQLAYKHESPQLIEYFNTKFITETTMYKLIENRDSGS